MNSENEKTATDRSQDSAAPAAGTFTQAKQRLASHPDASPESLTKLSTSGTSDVAQRVAENSATPSDVLLHLSSHNEPEVRGAVTENRNTPLEAVKLLAADEHPDVRYRVAENPNSPREVLETLTNDENPYVVARAQDTLKSTRSLRERADDALLAENFMEAENLYRELTSGLVNLLGESHAEVAESLHKLAAALTGQNKVDEAVVEEEKAAKIRSAIEAAK